MGGDFYKILHLNRDANDDDLKKAYNQFSQAYDVLSNPQKRAVYDRCTENSLKDVPTPEAGGQGGASYFSTGDRSTTSPFNLRNSDDVFAEFFGGSSPFGSMEGRSGGGMRESSFPSGQFGDNDLFSKFVEARGGGGSTSHQAHKADPIVHRLPCSLEDLYKGASKKMEISREIACLSGKTITVKEILTIDIKPGWKRGTKITFPEKGHERANVIPSDIVFIIDEKPHSVFTREGNDLIITHEISVDEALAGCTVHLTTLDGRSLTIPINNVISPTYEEVVPKEGMPNQKDPTKRENLRIKFNIKFPTRLTAEQKAGIKKLFG